MKLERTTEKKVQSLSSASFDFVPGNPNKGEKIQKVDENGRESEKILIS